MPEQVYRPIDSLHLLGEDPVIPQGGGAKCYVATGDSRQGDLAPCPAAQACRAAVAWGPCAALSSPMPLCHVLECAAVA